jgi:hypothetical protein
VSVAASDALGFVKDEILLGDGRSVGEALPDDPWIETEILEPVFRRRGDGSPAHRLVYAELPRGHAKSTYAAAVAVAEAVLHPGTEIIIAATDTEQARIVLEHTDAFLRRNGRLGSLFKAKGDVRSTDRSRIRVVASDAASAYGLGGTHRSFRLICDELTQWRDEALWTALVSGTGKVADVQTLVLSNAGFGGSSSWQWGVRREAQQAEWAHLFSAEGPIASWIDPAWIETMQGLLPGPAFERLILNRWASEQGDFVTRAQWEACIDPFLRPATGATRGASHIAGVDLGLTKDATAIAVVHSDGERVTLDELLVLQGTREEPVSIANVERILLGLAGRYPGLKVLADPWQFQGSIERLRGSMRISEFTFSASSVAKLSSALHEAISGARLRVFDDPELTREILGLQVRETPSGWRLDHRSGGYSDRAIALAMCVQEALRRGAPGRLPPLPGGKVPWWRLHETPDVDASVVGAGKLTSISYGQKF